MSFREGGSSCKRSPSLAAGTGALCREGKMWDYQCHLLSGRKADMGKARFCQNEFMILGEVPEMQVISVLMLLPDTCKLASYKYSWRPRWPAPLLMGTCQCIKATSWWVPAPEHEGNQEGTLRSPSRPFTWRKKHTHENSSYLAPLSFHTVPFHISSTLYKERKCSSANDVSHSCV